MSNRKKVLFFLPSNTGGAERMTILIARMLPVDQYEVKFVILHKSLGTIVNFIPSNYEIIHLPIKNIYDFATLRIIRLLKKEKPQVVFSSLLYINARLIIASKVCNVKVVVRNNIDLHNAKPSSRRLAKLTYRWANYVIAQQEEMRTEILQVLKLDENRVVTLQNPIDTDTIDVKSKVDSPYPEEQSLCTKYLWVARFHISKGQDLLVRAFKKVLQDKPNSHLYLVGSYNEKNEYDRSVIDYIKTSGLKNCVHLVGFDSNPYKWVRYCDCYVLPSRKEGLPNSLIDAMYLKRPVVAARCIPVIDRIVVDNYNGIIVSSEDVDAMANAMLKAINLNGFELTYKSADPTDYIKLF